VTFARALRYFVVEAARNLARSWQVSLLAISTIAVSLLVGGSFLLVASNLTRIVEDWRRSARVVVYLKAGLEAAEARDLRAVIDAAPWVTQVEIISRELAIDRFRATFPSVADLVGVVGDRPLPSSFELAFDAEAARDQGFDDWLLQLRTHPSVEMVDDDRDWVHQLTRVADLLRIVGVILGVVLLVAAMFTIGSVIRLTAFLYRDEIAVMRLVGATEFFIRGPFYAEGLLQGLFGGLTALAGLWTLWLGLLPRIEGSLLGLTLATSFLSPRDQVALVLLGTAAGLFGSITSLSRETLARG
jgi:cell division transport system permease protein